MIAAIAEKQKFSDRSDYSDHMETTRPAIAATMIAEIKKSSIPAIVVAAITVIAVISAIAGEWFPYDGCDR